ncbi:hypothetical protein WN51_10813 [Melipona quadrifasciata]|uniref:Uncharacterized protein n=1 Tax=Melipona quadrifasciata TaxID=166423 RepID=A0A0M9A4B9_9HYME|nr:hypothetical protein WN51_10813 [Melipona quadrifasciata]
MLGLFHPSVLCRGGIRVVLLLSFAEHSVLHQEARNDQETYNTCYTWTPIVVTTT